MSTGSKVIHQFAENYATYGNVCFAITDLFIFYHYRKFINIHLTDVTNVRAFTDIDESIFDVEQDIVQSNVWNQTIEIWNHVNHDILIKMVYWSRV